MKPTGLFSRHAAGLLVRALLFCVFLLLTAMAAEAQNEANNWIFGYRAGLTFPSAGNPVAFTGTPGIQINTMEGSSSISDQSGNLLFYTDGKTIWNKNHVAMPSGSNLLGGSSATQSALIVPWPGTECKKYYVFTVDAQEDDLVDTLRYTVVDMNRAGGLGDVAFPVVSNKNIPLQSPVSEKLAAVRDANGTGFWVVAHGYANPTTAVNSQFYAYHVTAGPLTMTPSTAGLPHESTAVTTNIPSAGQMKISPDGTLIASAVNAGFVEILNFNTITGSVTQGPPRTFSALSSPFTNDYHVYGLEFSPDSKVLYVSTTVAPSRLFQLKINPPTWTLVATGTPGVNYDMAQLQLGPNKKIYVARNNSSQIGEISLPTMTPGSAAGYTPTPTGVTLPPTSLSTLGLPTMIGGTFSCEGPQPEGQLKVCKVAGPGVAVGTLFTFTAGSSNFTVPAGPAPGGTCVVGPAFPVGSNVTVVETIPAGDIVSSISVAPPGQQVGLPNLATGTVNVIIGSGVTEVTYTDQKTGFLEICKRTDFPQDVIGNSTFSVTDNLGNILGPFVVPVGACSPPIKVPAGLVTINETSPPVGSIMVSPCKTIPAGQQGPCTPPTSTVTVAPGDISHQTIAFITNNPRFPRPGGSTSTAVTCAPNPAPRRSAVTCIARVTPASPDKGTPSGIVSFRDGDIALATVRLGADGTATFTTSTFDTGTHPIVGGYSGDTQFSSSVSEKFIETVGP